MKLFLTIIGVSIFCSVLAQNASISSVNEVCVDELIHFQVTSSDPISAVSWDFGDNSSSTQSSPAHSYSAYGVKTVTVSITLQNGGTATASKQIAVNDIPKPNFSQSGDYCLSDHNVCLQDSSSMGATTNGYQSRITLWGNGDTSTSSNPSSQLNYCYSDFPAAGEYNVVIEVVNDKGCEAKYFDTITILQDYDPSFRVTTQGSGCNEKEFCFINNTTPKPNEVVSWEYDYGDGNSTTNEDWNQNCHTYLNEGRFTVTLTTTLANGCVNSFTNTVVVNFVTLEIDPTIADTSSCFPQSFFFQNSSATGNLEWKIFDTDTNYIWLAGDQKSAVYYPNCPGDYLVRLSATLGECEDSSDFLRIHSNGFFPIVKLLNNVMCVPGDTTYLLNLSKYHPEARTSFLWKMDDDQAPRCSTSINNCEFETDTNAYHLYTRNDCYKPVLIMSDSTSGCVDSVTSIVAIETLDSLEFFADVPFPCYGNKNKYEISFSNNLCSANFKVLFDSGYVAPGWQKQWQKYVYPFTSDSSGWVTVGWAVSLGNEKFYRSADTSDFILDSSRLCIDTIWKHNWFQLHPEPKLDFEFERDSNCLPTNLTIAYTGTEEGRLAYTGIKWSFGDTMHFSYLPHDTVPDMNHTYTEAGKYFLYLVAEDTFGCYDFLEPEHDFGYINRIQGGQNVCIGDSTQLTQILRYIDDNYWYWEDTSRVERKYWDFGDGNGFSDSSDNPWVKYDAKGNYVVRLASIDSTGCTDTASFEIYVAGVLAGIKQPTQEYLCDQIIQLLDSSYSDFADQGDTIEHYYWEFGDFTSPNILENPFHYFSSNGRFLVRHAVTSVSGCTDTAEIEIYIKGPEPYFDIISDTVGCAPFTAEFKSTSKFVSQFLWYMGDPNNSIITSKNDTTFSFTYSEPGTYEIYLNGSDSFYNVDANNTYTCQSYFPDSIGLPRMYRRIIVLPIPEVDFSFIEPICVNQTVSFEANTDSIYTDFIWSVNGIEVDTTSGDYVHSFDQEGNYQIGLAPTYVPMGPYQRSCFDSIFKDVEVHYVNAGFEEESIGNCSEYAFTNFSTNAIMYSWDFGNPSSSNNHSDEEHTTHSFGRDSGTYKVCLAVESAEACKDTYCVDIQSVYSELLIPYNVFTPGSDGLNDTYFFDEENAELFHLRIYNRWGEQVFETKVSNVAWDGHDLKTGKELPEGTYFYVLDYKFACDLKILKMEGQVELIRE